MRIIPVQQNTQEWLDARVGVLTASNMDKVITAKTHKPSTSMDKLCFDSLAEVVLGRSLEDATTAFMERGTLVEEEARLWYEMEHNVDVRRVGLAVRDDGRVGCSPDGLVGDNGGLEIKCPSAGVHMKYLLAGVDDYFVQIQGSLWVTGRDWWDFLSYCPGLPPVLLRYEPDKAFIAKLAECAATYLKMFDGYKADLIANGALPDLDTPTFPTE